MALGRKTTLPKALSVPEIVKGFTQKHGFVPGRRIAEGSLLSAKRALESGIEGAKENLNFWNNVVRAFNKENGKKK